MAKFWPGFCSAQKMNFCTACLTIPTSSSTQPAQLPYISYKLFVNCEPQILAKYILVMHSVVSMVRGLMWLKDHNVQLNHKKQFVFPMFRVPPHELVISRAGDKTLASKYCAINCSIYSMLLCIHRVLSGRYHVSAMGY